MNIAMHQTCISKEQNCLFLYLCNKDAQLTSAGVAFD